MSDGRWCTINLRYFRREVLAPFDIEAQSPDEFVINVLGWHPHVS